MYYYESDTRARLQPDYYGIAGGVAEEHLTNTFDSNFLSPKHKVSLVTYTCIQSVHIQYGTHRTHKHFNAAFIQS